MLGIALIAYGFHRQRQVERAIGEGRFAPLEDRYALALAAFGILLGAAVVLVTFF